MNPTDYEILGFLNEDFAGTGTAVADMTATMAYVLGCSKPSAFMRTINSLRRMHRDGLVSPVSPDRPSVYVFTAKGRDAFCAEVHARVAKITRAFA